MRAKIYTLSQDLLPGKDGCTSDIIPGQPSLCLPSFYKHWTVSLSGCSSLGHDRHLVSGSHWSREADLRAAVNPVDLEYRKLTETGTSHITRYLRKGTWVPKKFISPFGCKMHPSAQSIAEGPMPRIPNTKLEPNCLENSLLWLRLFLMLPTRTMVWEYSWRELVMHWRNGGRLGRLLGTFMIRLRIDSRGLGI